MCLQGSLILEVMVAGAVAPVTFMLDMLLYTTEMNVQFMEVLQKSTKRCTLGHLSKGIHILGEALTTITELSIRSRNIGMGVVDIT